jgi:hypothetical protein
MRPNTGLEPTRYARRTRGIICQCVVLVGGASLASDRARLNPDRSAASRRAPEERRLMEAG